MNVRSGTSRMPTTAKPAKIRRLVGISITRRQISQKPSATSRSLRLSDARRPRRAPHARWRAAAGCPTCRTPGPADRIANSVMPIDVKPMHRKTPRQVNPSDAREQADQQRRHRLSRRSQSRCRSTTLEPAPRADSCPTISGGCSATTLPVVSPSRHRMPINPSNDVTNPVNSVMTLHTRPVATQSNARRALNWLRRPRSATETTEMRQR